MMELLLFLSLSCPKTIIVNQSTEVWNQEDQENYEIALKKKRCEYYYPKSPCMKYFIKREELTYRVICGIERKK